MQKTTFLILLFSIGALSPSFGQKKKDLLNEIESLRTEIDTTRQALAVATRKITVAQAEAETLRKENAGLRDANATLLKNLSGFSELSRKNTENATAALERLEAKEKQLSGITNAISSNDSTAIVLLTRSKQILGDESKLGVANGDIIVSNSLSSLFGSDTASELTEVSNDWLAKIAELIKYAPEREVVVEGLNITGEFGLTYQQANAVAIALTKTHGVSPDKIKVLAKDGNFKEGINIRLQPDYGDFYDMVKQDVRK